MRVNVICVLLYIVVVSACTLSSKQYEENSNAAIDNLLQKITSQADLSTDSALFISRKALSMSEKLNYGQGIAHSSYQLAKVLYQIGSLNLSISRLHVAIHQFELIKDQKGLAQSYSLIGLVHLRLENFDQALAHLRKSMGMFKASGNSNGQAMVYGQLGHLFEKSQQYDSALFYQHKALNHFTATNDSAQLATVFDNLGSIYEDLEAYDEANKNFSRAYELNKALGNIDEAIVNLNNLGDTYRKKGQLNKGHQLTWLAYKEAQSHNNAYQTQSAARDLGKSYRMMGKHDSAYFYQEISYELNDVIFNEQIAKEVANAQALFEVEQKQQTIALLEKEQELSRKISIGGFLGATILFGFIVYGSYLKVSKTSKERKLLLTENELSKAELINAQLNEEKLRTELENKRLEEKQMQMDLEMKNSSLSRSALHLIQKNEFLENLKSNLKKIKKSDPEDVQKKINKLTKSIELSFNLDDEWEEFETVFKQIHADFFDKLRDNHPNLSNTEVRLCAMIHANLHSHEIASIMSISSDSLRIARYRLRKKLGLEKGANLYNYLSSVA